MIWLWTYLRAIVGGIFFVVYTMFIAVGVVFFGSLKQTQILNKIIWWWAYLPLKFLGIEVKAFGTENLPRTRGGLFVFNHQSHFDILAFHLVADLTVRFGAKIELFKIPLFGHGMRAAGALPIVRENRSEVFKVYKESEIRIARGESFILAPEGTRQATPKIGSFKKGPFMFAVNAKAPLIPTVIVGSYEVMSKHDWLPNVGRMKRTIEIHFLKPVDTTGKESQIGELTTQVHDEMEKCFNERHAILYPETTKSPAR